MVIASLVAKVAESLFHLRKRLIEIICSMTENKINLFL